ncbi:hypothetical protein BX600DRAFT_451901 [Xylariales sp. PMI_506]|nr:hypothetical protein BX600DRAFT_451901 [Xylariales sp. PMI_506]
MGSLSQQRLLILDPDLSKLQQRHGRILSCNVDGSDLRTLIDEVQALPDGITVDHARGHIYWTNMGYSFQNDDGSIERANLDGSDRTTIVPAGKHVGLFTPKQITLATRSQKLYWCDREGMKVMRCNLDGSDIEVLVSTGSTAEDREDRSKWCVGIAVDESAGVFYWSQKGPAKGNQGRISRAQIETPAGSTPEARPDVEIVFDKLPEPIDLEIDEETKTLYWTDRGDPPFGNSLNKAYVGPDTAAAEAKGQKQVLAIRLHETIGLALDKATGMAYVTDLSGGVYAIDTIKKTKKVLFPELGDLTGIALVKY